MKVRVANPSEEFACARCGWPVYFKDWAYIKNQEASDAYCSASCLRGAS